MPGGLPAILFFPAWVYLCRFRPSAEKIGNKRLFPLPVSPASLKASSLWRIPAVVPAGWWGGLETCVLSLVWPMRPGKPEGQREVPDRRKKEQLFWLSLTFQMWSNLITSHPNTVKLQNILKPQEPVRAPKVFGFTKLFRISLFSGLLYPAVFACSSLLVFLVTSPPLCPWISL